MSIAFKSSGTDNAIFTLSVLSSLLEDDNVLFTDSYLRRQSSTQ